MFQIKDFVSIVASELNHARAVTTRITDYAPGSVSRTLMEAPAVEIEELYLQMFLGLREAIPVSTFLSFGFDKLPARYASGFVTVTSSVPLPQAIPVPVGTIFFATDGRTYQVNTADVFAAGATFKRFSVTSTISGVAGNVDAGGIASSALFGSTYTITNPVITSGKDAEGDPEREARFAAYIGSLSRGTVQSCVYAAGQSVIVGIDGGIAEYVTRVGVAETPGIVRVYLYSSIGVPSAALVSNAQLSMDGVTDPVTGIVSPGYRPAGVRCDVLPMVERIVPLSITVGMLPGVPLTDAVRQALTNIYATVINAVQPNTTLFLGSLTQSLLATDGLRTIVLQVSENIICGAGEALIPGALTIGSL